MASLRTQERMNYPLEDSKEYGKELINCNLLEQPVSSNFLTTLNSIPNKRGVEMVFLNIVTLPGKIDEICKYKKQNVANSKKALRRTLK